MPLHVSSTVVFIIRRSKLYYTASGIVTLKQVSGLKLLKLLRSYEKFTHKLYYCVLIFIELYFSNFRPFTCFRVTIPDAV